MMLIFFLADSLLGSGLALHVLVCTRDMLVSSESSYSMARVAVMRFLFPIDVHADIIS